MGRTIYGKTIPFTNQRAFDATCCIARLLELGALETFEDKVWRLAAHLCAGNRNACSTHLEAYYPWLPKRVIQRQGELRVAADGACAPPLNA